MPSRYATWLIDEGDALGLEFVADAIAFRKILPLPRISTLLNQRLNLRIA
jgi:hypothetical protein